VKIEGKSLLVFGSRTLDDERIEQECARFVDGTEYRFIVTALDPGGVCERVKHWAKACRLGVTLIQVGLNQEHARGMHNRRSIAALKMADHMLAIWDGASKGTAGEIALAKKMGVPTTIVRLEPKPRYDGGLAFDMPDLSALLDELTSNAGGTPSAAVRGYAEK
jgi:hypothetical protein